jgi:hypothetical protein
MYSAAANGNFELVKWLHENTAAGCTYIAMHIAAALCAISMQPLDNIQTTEGCTSAAMDGAAERGHLKVLKWLHTHRSEGFSSKALDGAASGDRKVATTQCVTGLKKLSLKASKTEGCGRLKVVQLFLGCGGEFDLASAMERTIVCEESEIVCYLGAQRTDVGESVEEMRARLRDQTICNVSSCVPCTPGLVDTVPIAPKSVWPSVDNSIHCAGVSLTNS